MADESHRWISTFLQAQAAEHSAAHNTQLAYGRDLLAFAAFLAPTALSQASRADVETYLLRCAAEGLSQSTRARRLSSIRQLYRFAFEEGWRADNPALQITGPGATRHLPKNLSQDDVLRLLNGRAVPSSPDLVELNEALTEVRHHDGRAWRVELERVQLSGPRAESCGAEPVAAAAWVARDVTPTTPWS